jgi:hypothetical protein
MNKFFAFNKQRRNIYPIVNPMNNIAKNRNIQTIQPRNNNKPQINFSRNRMNPKHTFQKNLLERLNNPAGCACGL